MANSKFTRAANELLKGNIGNAMQALTATNKADQVNEVVRPGTYNGLEKDFYYFGDDGKTTHFTFQSPGSPMDAYRRCPPLQAVINRKARAYINGKNYILNSKGKEAQGDTANRLRKLLTRPNYLQNWNEFDAQTYIYQQLFGYSPVIVVVPVGYDPTYATAIWNIPPFMCTIDERDDIMYFTAKSKKDLVKSIKVSYKNTYSYLNMDYVYLLTEFQPSGRSVIIPGSRIEALEMPINNIIGAYESRNVLINRRGALGILTKDPGTGQYGPLPAPENYKEELQSDFGKYGLLRSQWTVVITEAALKWQQMGFPTKDLMLFEEIVDDVMRICDTYNFPSPLINTDKGPSNTNTKEFNQQLYNDGVIPESISNYEQWNEILQTEQFNLRIERDYSHLPILQKDKKLEADARKVLGEALLAEFYANLVTFNRVLELMGEDTRSGGDVYYHEAVAQGMSFALPGAPGNRSNTVQDSNNANENESNGQEGTT